MVTRCSPACHPVAGAVAFAYPHAHPRAASSGGAVVDDAMAEIAGASSGDLRGTPETMKMYTREPPAPGGEPMLGNRSCAQPHRPRKGTPFARR